jgi:PhnB protein
MAIEPYLFFNGRCEDAIEFYKKALGAEVLMLSATKTVRNPRRLGWCLRTETTRSCTRACASVTLL